MMNPCPGVLVSLNREPDGFFAGWLQIADAFAEHQERQKEQARERQRRKRERDRQGATVNPAVSGGFAPRCDPPTRISATSNVRACPFLLSDNRDLLMPALWCKLCVQP
jgi:hypothetical protein